MDTEAIRHGLHHKAWWIPLNCSLYLLLAVAPLRLSEGTFPISHWDYNFQCCQHMSKQGIWDCITIFKEGMSGVQGLQNQCITAHCLSSLEVAWNNLKEGDIRCSLKIWSLSRCLRGSVLHAQHRRVDRWNWVWYLRSVARVWICPTQSNASSSSLPFQGKNQCNCCHHHLLVGGLGADYS